MFLINLIYSIIYYYIYTFNVLFFFSYSSISSTLYYITFFYLVISSYKFYTLLTLVSNNSACNYFALLYSSSNFSALIFISYYNIALSESNFYNLRYNYYIYISLSFNVSSKLLILILNYSSCVLHLRYQSYTSNYFSLNLLFTYSNDSFDIYNLCNASCKSFSIPYIFNNFSYIS